MAIRSVVESDLSGKTGASTVTFGLGNTWFEVDLTDEERKDLEKVLKTYTKVGRKAVKKSTANRFVPETTPEERDMIRAWAKENGFELAERGKIPNKIYFAYKDAHPGFHADKE